MAKGVLRTQRGNFQKMLQNYSSLSLDQSLTCLLIVGEDNSYVGDDDDDDDDDVRS